MERPGEFKRKGKRNIMSQNNGSEICRGDRVAVTKSPKESAFGGWIGTVSEPDRRSNIAGRMIAVNFDHPVNGVFADVLFMPNELAKV